MNKASSSASSSSFLISSAADGAGVCVPPSPRADFGMSFFLLARKWRRALDAHLLSVGLTDATWVPLVHLEKTGGGITQKQLAALVGIDGSSLVRLLDILTRDGLVERRADVQDGRARLVYLTVAGAARVAEIRRALESAEAQMLDGVGDADLQATLDQFQRIDANLDRLQAHKDGAEAGPMA